MCDAIFIVIDVGNLPKQSLMPYLSALPVPSVQANMYYFFLD